MGSYRTRRMARLTKHNLQIKRGEIWTTDLRPGRGFEASKKRPGLVISANSINTHSPIVIIIPISSQVSQMIGPERILLPKKDTGLEKESLLLVYQLRAIDTARLGKRIGNISKNTLQEVEEALKLILNLDDNTEV